MVLLATILLCIRAWRQCHLWVSNDKTLQGRPYAACSGTNTWLCDDCDKNITFFKEPVIKNPSSHLDKLIVLAPYGKNKVLQSLLHQYKYFYAFDIGNILSKKLKKLAKENLEQYEEYTVTWVPLHWKRFLERGFNQSYFLASEFKNKQRLLKRSRHTQQQAKLNRSNRLENLKNAFAITKKEIPEKVIIVDDVASTCATLNECAAILKNAGVKEVIGLVVARNN